MSTIGESPEYVQTSLAGAICLGMESGRFMKNTKCGCLNLLLTYKNGCSASCSYCGLAHNRQVDSSKTFIRVKWPTYAMTEIIDRVKNRPHPFKRVCVSMITHGHALADTCTIIKQVREETGLPVSALIAPTVMKGKTDMEALKEAGAERIGVAIDAVTEELFEKHRGHGVGGPHRWQRFWESVSEAVEVFGKYNVGVHLIVGLGETEEQMLDVMGLDKDSLNEYCGYLYSN
jgi:biotin synthase